MPWGFTPFHMFIGIGFFVPIILVAVLVAIFRNSARVGRYRPYDPAAEQLRMRFARGEITQADYENGMRLLGYEKRP